MPDALPITLRPATDADLSAINAIYNHYVAHSAALYQDEPWTDAERRAWFDGHGPRHPRDRRGRRRRGGGGVGVALAL